MEQAAILAEPASCWILLPQGGEVHLLLDELLQLDPVGNLTGYTVIFGWAIEVVQLARALTSKIRAGYFLRRTLIINVAI